VPERLVPARQPVVATMMAGFQVPLPESASTRRTHDACGCFLRDVTVQRGAACLLSYCCGGSLWPLACGEPSESTRAAPPGGFGPLCPALESHVMGDLRR
jgi:hypothetical protein